MMVESDNNCSDDCDRKTKLQALVDSLRDKDVTDPVCMDEVNAYYQEVIDESDQFMKVLEQNLEFAEISWRRPWYQENTCLTRTFSVKPEEVEEQNEKYLTGTITLEETTRIAKNWKKLVKKYHIPDRLICLARWKNREKSPSAERFRIFVVAYLARGLKRTLSQVHRHVVSHFGGPNRGPFTKDEKKLIQICIHHNPKKAGIYLSTILERESRGLYKTIYYDVNRKPACTKIKWTLPLATKFVKLLMEYTGCSLDELKYANISSEVWTKLEKDFQKQKIYLRYFWSRFLHNQLFVKCKVSVRQLRKKIFKLLRNSPYKVWRDIRWKEVAGMFPDGFTFDFLYRHAVKAIQNCPNHCSIPLQEVVEYGLNFSRTRRSRGKRLRTLILNDEGNLEVRLYDEKLKVTYFD